MRPWFERDPGRLIREYREVKDRYPESVLFRTDSGLLAWLTKMRVGGDEYAVVAVYPAAFPHKRIDVFPVYPAWKNRSHQTADGRLCLLTYVPNRWDPSYGAAFMLDRARGWIELQLGISKPEHLGDVPFWEGEYLQATYISEEALPFLRDQSCGELYVVPWHERNIYLVTRLRSFNGNEMDVAPPGRFSEAMGAPLSPEIKGLWFVAGEAPPWERRPESIDELGAFMRAHSACPKGVGRLRTYIERHQETGDLRALIPVVVVNAVREGRDAQHPGHALTVIRHEEKESMLSSALLPVDYDKEVISRNSGLVDLGTLGNKTITVVGLGAVGSVATVALAKAGAKKFRLFDHEKIEPANVARHACDLRDVGRKKVDAVADLIVRRNPEASATTHDVNVLSEGGIAALARVLEDSDIVLVATGDRESAGLVNRLSLDTGARAVYASVMAGARGGELFRVVPGETPCYECVQRYKANDPRWKAAAEYDERTRIETPRDGCGDLFMPGTAVDTDTIALAQARLALQTLLRSEPGSALRDEVCDYLLIGNTRGEPFAGSYHVIKDNSYRRRLEDCAQCGTPQTSLRAEDETLYGQILEEVNGR